LGAQRPGLGAQFPAGVLLGAYSIALASGAAGRLLNASRALGLRRVATA
jgi:hypothetical protein